MVVEWFGFDMSGLISCVSGVRFCFGVPNHCKGFMLILVSLLFGFCFGYMLIPPINFASK